MGFGNFLAQTWSKAPAASKAAATTVANTAQSAYDYGEREVISGYNYTRDKAVQGYDYAQEKAVQGVDYARDKALQGYDYAQEKAVQGVDYAREKAVQGYEYGRDKAVAGYEAVRDAPANAAAIAKKAVRDAKLEAIKSRYDNARKALGQEKAGSPVKKCPKASARCSKLKDALDKAELSDDAYNETSNDKSKIVAGYRRLDPKDPTDKAELLRELGVTKEDLEPDGLDFRARIYVKPDKSVNGKKEYVISYRGTETGNDWKENVKQGSGTIDTSKLDTPTNANKSGIKTKSSYQLAVRLAKKAAQKTQARGDKLSYTGHSLGGGMASAAAASTSSHGKSHPAVTYNAAGLHADTLGGAYPDPPAQVDAYFTPTDPLSALQDNRALVLGGLIKGANAVPVLGTQLSVALGGWVLGNEVGGTPIMPKAYGSRYILPFPPDTEPPDISIAGLKEAHGMQLVKKGIKRARQDLKCPP